MTVPTKQQLEWQQQRQMAMFVHFGINTFYGMEWSDGTLDPVRFDPEDLDCRQWALIAKRAGMAHIILTAKHHDGFCLWPTATKDYSVAASPWRDGRGDVVRDLADACAEEGIGLGLYLSPWDRQDPDWGERPEVYDERYIRQLTELCTQYGPLVELWFDGAGSEQHPYQWDDIMAVIHEHQPDAMIFNMGHPTIRWVGNEDGLANDPCIYAVDATHKSIYDDGFDSVGEIRYLPPECDVAIRANWFWQPDDLETLKSVNHLLGIWYRSVGLGANLLLNVPADRRGLIDPCDEERLVEFADAVQDRFTEPVPATLSQKGSTVTATFPGAVAIDHILLREHLQEGQHVMHHRVLGDDGVALIDDVHTIGSQRIHAFPTVTTSSLTIELEPGGRLDGVEGYLTGAETLPTLEWQPGIKAEKMT